MSTLGFEKIIAFDPAVSSSNLGDSIISDSASAYLEALFPDSFMIKVSTHLPTSIRYMHMLRDFKARFVLGSNLLKSHMLLGFRQWDVSLVKAPFVGPVILMGCGWWQYERRIDLYSKMLYKALLSPDVLHSVRDNYTVKQLESMGIRNVLNTACPTMWKFTEQHCGSIPREKADSVVTTLTDYYQDPRKDHEMLSLLSENYKTVYLWMQGSGDMNYYKSIAGNWKNIVFIQSKLDAYNKVLEMEDIEYVGTRLHAGIRALQRGKRAMIIAVDNRAVEKKRDFNLPVIERENQEELKNLIFNSRRTEIHIPERQIEEYLGQFGKP
ncbi:MAG: polysaccharide pyruvyl transferase family protein [Candidatus Faecivicinus sp.]